MHIGETIHLIKDIFYPEKRLLKLGIENNFEVINLAMDLQRYAIKSKEFIHGFKNTKMGEGHWNEKGHSTSSELLSNKVCNLYN